MASQNRLNDSVDTNEVEGFADVMYVRVYGHLKLYQGKKQVVAYAISIIPNITTREDGDGDSAEEIPDRNSEEQIGENSNVFGINFTRYCKPVMFQQGVLRTNCIDCLDRTNVAQYCYGLVALGHQLHAISFIDIPDIDFDSPLADDLMRLYEAMGDTLAFQYGGSAAHNKIFSERRGQPKALTQSQELLRTLQRYYSNAYMDAQKQDAINVFLGHFRPQNGRPALWELDTEQHFSVGRHGLGSVVESPRSFIKRSCSDGSILSDSKREQIEDSCQPRSSIDSQQLHMIFQ